MNFWTGRLSPWNYLRIGIFFLPIVPAFGIINVLIATIKIWQTHFRQIIENPINRVWGIFSILLTLNSCIAYHPDKALIGLFNFLPCFAFFAAIKAFVNTPIQLYQIAEVIVIGSIPIHILGLIQKLFPSEFQINLLLLNIPLHNGPDLRISSLFDNSNIFGFYTVFTLGMTLIAWDVICQKLTGQKLTGQKLTGQKLASHPVISPTALPESPHQRHANTSLWLKFILVTATLLLNFISITTSQSRIALVASFLILIGYFIHKQWTLITGFIGGFIASILLAGYTNSFPGQIARQIIPAVFWRRLQNPYPQGTPLEALRPNIWKTAVDLTWERPLTGWGLRNFPEIFQERTSYWMGHPHNLFLMLSSETGLVLTVIFVSTIGLIFCQGIFAVRSNNLNRNIVDGPEQHTLSNANTVYCLYLLCASSWIVLNLVDVTLYHLTLNIFSWLIFGAINGVASHYNKDLYPLFIRRLRILN
jgi:O-Antigen ligase